MERLIRRAGRVIIGTFLLAFVTFVVATLVDDWEFFLRSYGGTLLLQVLAGPVSALVTLTIIVIRSKEPSDAGSSRRSFVALRDFGAAVVSTFGAYGRRFGRDRWIVVFLLSGTWSLILLWMVFPRGGPASACPDCGSIRLPYLLVMSALWAWLGSGCWRAAGRRDRHGAGARI